MLRRVEHAQIYVRRRAPLLQQHYCHQRNPSRESRRVPSAASLVELSSVLRIVPHGATTVSFERSPCSFSIFRGQTHQRSRIPRRLKQPGRTAEKMTPGENIDSSSLRLPSRDTPRTSAGRPDPP